MWPLFIQRSAVYSEPRVPKRCMCTHTTHNTCICISSKNITNLLHASPCSFLQESDNGREKAWKGNKSVMLAL